MTDESLEIKWEWDVRLTPFGRSSYVVIPPELRRYKKWEDHRKMRLILTEDGTVLIEPKETDP